MRNHSAAVQLYYGLDHSNPEKQRRNQADVARGYVYVVIADHLEHGNV